MSTLFTPMRLDVLTLTKRRYSSLPQGLQLAHTAATLATHADTPLQYWRAQPHTHKPLFNEPPMRQGDLYATL